MNMGQALISFWSKIKGILHTTRLNMNIASEIEQAIRDVRGSDLSNGRKVELVAELLIAYCKALTAELE